MGWIEDPSGRCLKGLKLAAASVIIDLAKLKETSGEEGFRTARGPMRAILQKYFTFPIEGDDLRNAKNTLLIRPHAPKVAIDHSRFQATLTPTQSADLVKGINSALSETDSLGLTPRQQQNIEDDYMTHDSNVVGHEKEVEGNLLREHAQHTASLRRESGYKYAHHSFLSLRAPVIAPEEESVLARSYLSKGTFGRISQICAEVELEKKRLHAIVVHATAQTPELDRELALLEDAKMMRASTEVVVKSELAKMKEKKKLLLAKKAAVRAQDVSASAVAKSGGMSLPLPPATAGLQEYSLDPDPELDDAVRALMAFEDATGPS